MRALPVLAAFVVVLTSGCRASVEDLVASGDELLFAQQYEAAARKYEAAVVEAGERGDADAVELRALALRKLGEVRHLFLSDLQGALRAYRAAVQQGAGTEHAFHARISMVRLLHDRVGDVVGATRELTAVIEAFPDRAELPALRLELAQLAFRAGKLRLASQQAEHLLDAPDRLVSYEAALLLATIHRLEGRHEEALALYEGVLAGDLAPDAAARVRLEAAHCLEALGRFQEAIAMYEGADSSGVDAQIIAARITRVRARLDTSRVTGQRVARGGTSIRF